MSEMDDAFARARMGDLRAFADWMGRVERPIRISLHPFARAVDVEGVVQETLMRMWLLATDAQRGPLTGESASLRFAIGMARNIARNQTRKHRREQHLPSGDLPEPLVEPEPPVDPGLGRAIADCLKRIARRPLEALRARLDRGAGTEDRDLAKSLGMSLNTFLQNIVRARKQLASCLEGKGVPMQEFVS